MYNGTRTSYSFKVTAPVAILASSGFTSCLIIRINAKEQFDAEVTRAKRQVEKTMKRQSHYISP